MYQIDTYICRMKKEFATLAWGLYLVKEPSVKNKRRK